MFYDFCRVAENRYCRAMWVNFLPLTTQDTNPLCMGYIIPCVDKTWPAHCSEAAIHLASRFVPRVGREIEQYRSMLLLLPLTMEWWAWPLHRGLGWCRYIIFVSNSSKCNARDEKKQSQQLKPLAESCLIGHCHIAITKSTSWQLLLLRYDMELLLSHEQLVPVLFSFLRI